MEDKSIFTKEELFNLFKEFHNSAMEMEMEKGEGGRPIDWEYHANDIAGREKAKRTARQSDLYKEYFTDFKKMILRRVLTFTLQKT